MGYRSKKNAQNTLKQNLLRWGIIALCVLIAALCTFSAFVPAESWKYHLSLPKVSLRAEGELRVHYLDAKSGACTLLELPDGKTVLVGGGADDGEAKKNVLRFLNALKIKRIDAVVVPDVSSRGVGVLRELAQYYSLGAAYLPKKEGTNAVYTAFLADLDRKDVPRYTASFSTLWENEEGCLRILYPLADDYSLEEVVLTLRYQGVEVLLGARLGEDVYQALKTEKSLGYLEKWGIVLGKFDVVQAPPDVDALALTSFAETFACKAAIFPCRGGASDRPNEECLQALSACGVATYRTDLHGFITLTISNGSYSIQTQK